MVKKVIEGLYNLLLGIRTTSKHLGRHAVTLQYPTERWPMPERSRGVVVLLSDTETGELNCTVCMLCMRACPSAAIKIEQHRDEETKKRILDEFIVDNSICCFCGLCQDACNFAAIKLAPKYEFSTINKKDLIWKKDKLQEMGRDVPYEKPKKKAPAKPVEKKPVDKPATTSTEKVASNESPAEDTKLKAEANSELVKDTGAPKSLEAKPAVEKAMNPEGNKTDDSADESTTDETSGEKPQDKSGRTGEEQK